RGAAGAVRRARRQGARARGHRHHVRERCGRLAHGGVRGRRPLRAARARLRAAARGGRGLRGGGRRRRGRADSGVPGVRRRRCPRPRGGPVARGALSPPPESLCACAP
ncbi:unnamed protein product, partial [Prorocentrum cordatum]